MRIIGGRDYYDYVTQYGIDTSLVFHRKPQCVRYDNPDLKMITGFNLSSTLMIDPNKRIQVVPALFFVGTKSYVGIRVYQDMRAWPAFEPQVHHFYDLLEFREWMRPQLVSGSDFSSEKTIIFSDTDSFLNRRTLKHVFDRYHDKPLTNIHSDIIVGVYYQNDSRCSETNKGSFDSNGDFLKNWEFWNCITAEECWQNISSRLTMPNGSDKFSEPNDKVKIQKAGFDLKSSFRKGKIK